MAHEPTADGSDADLLRRFADTQDEAAFVALLDRHGPLAWAVCRQMLPNPADAEDAFQATFLALVQSVGKLGRVKSVGGWLHGVAVKVCLKVRRTAARRRARDERSARSEATSPEPQWDDLHAAVHEEIDKLPAVLRAVFVLCEMEGVRQPDAAARLGCKLGTVSGRLTRARQALLKALSARGLAPAAVIGVMAVGGSAAAVPLALMEKALAAARAGGGVGLAVPSGVLQLAQSVTGGTSMKVKILTAAVAVAAGVMTAGGWLTGAMGQPPAPPVPTPQAPEFPGPQAPPVPQPPVDPFAGTGEDPPPAPRAPQPPRPVDPVRPVEPRQPRDPQPPARPVEPRDPRDGRDPQPNPRDPARPGPDVPGPPPAVRPPQQRVEHLLTDAPSTKDEIEKLIRKHEAAGWEFAGQAGAGKETQMVFKRPKGIPPGDWGVPRGVPPQPPVPRVPGVPLPPRGDDGGGRLPPGGAPQPPRGRDGDPQPPRRDTIPPRDPEPRRGGGGEGGDVLPPRRDGGDLPPAGVPPIPRGRDADTLPPRREPASDELPTAVEPADEDVAPQIRPGFRAVERITYVKKQGPGGAMYYEPVRQITFVPVGNDIPSSNVPFGPVPSDVPLPSPTVPAPASDLLRANPPAAEETELHVLELKNAQPEAMSVHVKKFFPAAEVSTDAETGSLVIRCGKKTLDEVKKLVEKLDKPSKNRGNV